MKPVLKLAAYVLLAGVLVHLSCKKEYSCESCSEKNKPPIANAGPDQVITLPTDSVSLNGSSSNDPDGKISEWLWTKISGPASFTIINPTDSTTKVKTLVTGTYLFELKVTDNGGLSAKDTMRIIVDAVATNNHPPIANAGLDTTITLPSNTINLDGSRSTDPENNITSYAWTKISGPSSFNIANANAVQTQVTNLVEGDYKFELKVTDAGGLFSKDIVQVIVNAAPPPTSCNQGSRPLINAQLIPFVTSPDNSDISLAAILGNKMVFLRHGISTGGPRGTGILKGYVYDMVTQTWTITQLSEQRWDMGIVSAGNKVFLAGGIDVDNNGLNYYFSIIDIYDASTDSWSVSYLSKPRRQITAATINNKVFFAGGYEEMSPNNYPVSNLVEIYDLSTNSWSVRSLSESRVYLSAVTFGSKIYFAGGVNGLNTVTKKVDVYDNSTNTWATFDLQEPKAAMSSIVVNNKIYWAGGVNENLFYNNGSSYWIWTSNVEIKDINTGISIATCLFQPNLWPWNNAAVQKNDKIVFFTGTDINAVQNKFDIYDTNTKSWSIGVLPKDIEGTIISNNNTIYVSSGSQVWKLEF